MVWGSERMTDSPVYQFSKGDQIMTYSISHNTYPNRAALKKIGCKWNVGGQCWDARGEEMLAAALAIVGPRPTATLRGRGTTPDEMARDGSA